MGPQEIAIADAAIRVIVHQGFDAVSVRKVAAEAGVAPGTVQYFMGTREELLGKALVRSTYRQHERVSALNLASVADPLTRLHTALMELLPTGTLQREDAALWVALGAASSTRSALAELYQEELRLFQQRLVDALAFNGGGDGDGEADGGGEKSCAGEPARTARLITALVNGLTLDYLNAPSNEEVTESIAADLKVGLRRILRPRQ